MSNILTKSGGFGKFQRAYHIWQLTHKYVLPRQVPLSGAAFHLNGQTRHVEGQNALPLLLNVVLEDCYGLKRFAQLPNIVDIGANIGVFALHASTLFPSALIHAYEPFEASLNDLQRNLASANCQIYPEAVGATDQQAYIMELDDLSACYIEAASEVAKKTAPGQVTKGHPVQMVSLDTVAKRLKGPIALLKLDCEGSEYEILQTDTFRSVRYVVGEFHTCAAGDPVSGLKILEEQGFYLDVWAPFPGNEAGEFWASNRNNTEVEKSWLK